MSCHQRVGNEFPVASLYLDAKKLKEDGAIDFVSEELRTVNCLGIDVVRNACDFDARWRHTTRMQRERAAR